MAYPGRKTWPGNPAAAVVELRLGLDNYVAQLHRTVAQTKQTHFYKALLKLGGTWH